MKKAGKKRAGSTIQKTFQCSTPKLLYRKPLAEPHSAEDKGPVLIVRSVAASGYRMEKKAEIFTGP